MHIQCYTHARNIQNDVPAAPWETLQLHSCLRDDFSNAVIPLIPLISRLYSCTFLFRELAGKRKHLPNKRQDSSNQVVE